MKSSYPQRRLLSSFPLPVRLCWRRKSFRFCDTCCDEGPNLFVDVGGVLVRESLPRPAAAATQHRTRICMGYFGPRRFEEPERAWAMRWCSLSRLAPKWSTGDTSGNGSRPTPCRVMSRVAESLDGRGGRRTKAHSRKGERARVRNAPASRSAKTGVCRHLLASDHSARPTADLSDNAVKARLGNKGAGERCVEGHVTDLGPHQPLYSVVRLPADPLPLRQPRLETRAQRLLVVAHSSTTSHVRVAGLKLRRWRGNAR